MTAAAQCRLVAALVGLRSLRSNYRRASGNDAHRRFVGLGTAGRNALLCTTDPLSPLWAANGEEVGLRLSLASPVRGSADGSPLLRFDPRPPTAGQPERPHALSSPRKHQRGVGERENAHSNGSSFSLKSADGSDTPSMSALTQRCVGSPLALGGGGSSLSLAPEGDGVLFLLAGLAEEQYVGGLLGLGAMHSHACALSTTGEGDDEGSAATLSRLLSAQARLLRLVASATVGFDHCSTEIDTDPRAGGVSETGGGGGPSSSASQAADFSSSALLPSLSLGEWRRAIVDAIPHPHCYSEALARVEASFSSLAPPLLPTTVCPCGIGASSSPLVVVGRGLLHQQGTGESECCVAPLRILASLIGHASQCLAAAAKLHDWLRKAIIGSPTSHFTAHSVGVERVGMASVGFGSPLAEVSACGIGNQIVADEGCGDMAPAGSHVRIYGDASVHHHVAAAFATLAGLEARLAGFENRLWHRADSECCAEGRAGDTTKDAHAVVAEARASTVQVLLSIVGSKGGGHVGLSPPVAERALEAFLSHSFSPFAVAATRSHNAEGGRLIVSVEDVAYCAALGLAIAAAPLPTCVSTSSAFPSVNPHLRLFKRLLLLLDDSLSRNVAATNGGTTRALSPASSSACVVAVMGLLSAMSNGLHRFAADHCPSFAAHCAALLPCSSDSPPRIDANTAAKVLSGACVQYLTSMADCQQPVDPAACTPHGTDDLSALHRALGAYWHSIGNSDASGSLRFSSSVATASTPSPAAASSTLAIASAASAHERWALDAQQQTARGAAHLASVADAESCERARVVSDAHIAFVSILIAERAALGCVLARSLLPSHGGSEAFYLALSPYSVSPAPQAAGQDSARRRGPEEVRGKVSLAESDLFLLSPETTVGCSSHTLHAFANPNKRLAAATPPGRLSPSQGDLSSFAFPTPPLSPLPRVSLTFSSHSHHEAPPSSSPLHQSHAMCKAFLASSDFDVSFASTAASAASLLLFKASQPNALCSAQRGAAAPFPAAGAFTVCSSPEDEEDSRRSGAPPPLRRLNTASGTAMASMRRPPATAEASTQTYASGEPLLVSSSDAGHAAVGVCDTATPTMASALLREEEERLKTKLHAAELCAADEAARADGLAAHVASLRASLAAARAQLLAAEDALFAERSNRTAATLEPAEAQNTASEVTSSALPSLFSSSHALMAEGMLAAHAATLSALSDVILLRELSRDGGACNPPEDFSESDTVPAAESPPHLHASSAHASASPPPAAPAHSPQTPLRGIVNGLRAKVSALERSVWPQSLGCRDNSLTPKQQRPAGSRRELRRDGKSERAHECGCTHSDAHAPSTRLGSAAMRATPSRDTPHHDHHIRSSDSAYRYDSVTPAEQLRRARDRSVAVAAALGGSSYTYPRTKGGDEPLLAPPLYAYPFAPALNRARNNGAKRDVNGAVCAEASGAFSSSASDAPPASEAVAASLQRELDAVTAALAHSVRASEERAAFAAAEADRWAARSGEAFAALEAMARRAEAAEAERDEEARHRRRFAAERAALRQALAEAAEDHRRLSREVFSLRIIARGTASSLAANARPLRAASAGAHVPFGLHGASPPQGLGSGQGELADAAPRARPRSVGQRGVAPPGVCRSAVAALGGWRGEANAHE